MKTPMQHCQAHTAQEEPENISSTAWSRTHEKDTEQEH